MWLCGDSGMNQGNKGCSLDNTMKVKPSEFPDGLDWGNMGSNALFFSPKCH